MLAPETFRRVKEQHGWHASWAVWAEGTRPKENIGDLSIFEDESILTQLNPNIVLVGLNISRPIDAPSFGTFHDGSARSMDYKIRYALHETKLWGAYITDIIKGFAQKASKEVVAYWENNEDFRNENLNSFEAELKDLGVNQPTLIAFGQAVFDILNTNLKGRYDIWRLRHYSDYSRNKEQYREEVVAIVNSATFTTSRTNRPR